MSELHSNPITQRILEAELLKHKDRIDELTATNAQLRAEVERGRKALEVAASALSRASSEFNHPNFTDRYGDGPYFKSALETVLASMQAPVAEKEGEKDEY